MIFWSHFAEENTKIWQELFQLFHQIYKPIYIYNVLNLINTYPSSSSLDSIPPHLKNFTFVSSAFF